MQGIAKKIKSHKEAIEYLTGLQDSYPNDDWGKYDSRFSYHSKAIELLEAGLDFQDHPQGFIIYNKYIVALRKNKWRVNGKGQWYFYKNINQLKEKYINNNAVKPQNEITLVSKLNRQWDSYVAKLGQHQII